MYSDTEQWSSVRQRILVDGVSRKQVVRETGISMSTVRKMLRHEQPMPYQLVHKAYPKLGPYVGTIRELLLQNKPGGDGPRCSRREVYDQICAQGFTGSYGTVQNYISSLKHDDRKVWGATYDQIRFLKRRSAVSLMMQTAKKCRAVELRGKLASTRNSQASLQTHQECPREKAFTWMRKVLQKKIRNSALRGELGHVPELERRQAGAGAKPARSSHRPTRSIRRSFRK